MQQLRSFIVLIFVLGSGIAHTQPKSYQFRHLDNNAGLSHNQVNCFFKDARGFLWIGTVSGLNRFDGYSVKVYVNDPNDSTSISSNSISSLFETPDGKMAVVNSNGVNFYNPETEKFTTQSRTFYQRYNIPEGIISTNVKDQDGNFWFIHATAGIIFVNPKLDQSVIIQKRINDPSSVISNSIRSVAHDAKGNHYVIHANGTIERIVIKDKTYEVVSRIRNLGETVNEQNVDYRMLADRDGDLWIYGLNDNKGLFFYSVANETFRHFSKGSPGIGLNTNLISSIVQDDKGIIWVSTDHGGVNLIDKRNFSISYLLNRPEDDKSIGQNSINSLYKDKEGIIWIGTFKRGVSYYHENIIRFPLYKHYPLDRSGLPYGDVNRFVEDKNGNLWIGTNGGGLIFFDRKAKTFRQYKNDPNDSRSLSSDVIVSLCIDHEQKLWIGTYFGGLNCLEDGRFSRYTYNPADAGSLSDVSVWEIFEDSKKRLWIGTLHGGLNLFDRQTQNFKRFQNTDLNSIQSNYIAALHEDKQGNIWIGTTDGMDVLMASTNSFVHYENVKGDTTSLSSNSVYDIREDANGRIWIATGAGINLFEQTSKTFRAFKETDGLPHNTILTILEEKPGELWVSTPNGISNMTVSGNDVRSSTVSFKNYDDTDGLQGKQFNENAALKTRAGELIFGGANGFNIFQPDQLGENKNIPVVVLSDLQVFSKSVKPGEEINGSVILEKSLAATKAITLPPGLDLFSIEFAALNYFHPEKNKYLYRLEGFNDDWLPVDPRSRKVSFTNLDPGTYTFHVKASNNDGYWNEEGVRLKIDVLPPFWKTRWAFLLYCSIVIAGLLVTRKLIQQRERLKYEREQEKLESIRMHELDMMKIRFFTNVSHEFRTPLTLILTPLEKMVRQAKEPEQVHQFELIQRNAKRLLNLVNQLLDFRKLEVQEINFNPSEGDIIKFIEETVFSFSDLSEKKDIKLTFHSSSSSLETIFDQDKLEKILFNLLSNAFKFTPEHGAVSVQTHLEEQDGIRNLIINVKDTGIGIPTDKLDKIFERFFQNDLPRSVVNQGSGIGLAITKEFTRIHGGAIRVESQVGVGSSFTVSLPITEVFHHDAITSPSPVLVSSSAPDETAHNQGKPILLLVEDNEDFRFYLKDNLRDEFRIIEARNGSEGWEKILESLPDLVVSDIMMPEMNGIELCKKVRTDQRVSHTPFILLTARSAEEQKLEGFEVGADDYVTKPFNFEILVSRIRNLIHQREKFHTAFSHQLTVKASELNITSLDEKFIQKAIACVELNISNADFTVEDLSHELGISRAHFYKKIMSLTGKSPLEFIRTIRLQQAAQLLLKSQLTVAEVAYQVGFNNPKYFARYFKEAYHVLPSVYAATQKNKLK